jgi:hypothetical protein
MQQMSGLKDYFAFAEDQPMPSATAELQEETRAYMQFVLSSPAVLMCTLVLLITHIWEDGSWSQLPLIASLPLALIFVLLLVRWVRVLTTTGGALLILVFTMVLSQRTQHDSKVAITLYGRNEAPYRLFVNQLATIYYAFTFSRALAGLVSIWLSTGYCLIMMEVYGTIGKSCDGHA